MNAELKQWLEAEMRDFETAFKAYNGGTMKKVPLWMALCVAGLVALGVGVGAGWDYILRVHLPAGVGLAAFVGLCFWVQTRSVSMKKVRASYEKALQALSPSDQAAFARQAPCGKAGFENRLTDKYPARLTVGPDYWLYFRGLGCRVFKVSDMQRLYARQETTRVSYNMGDKHVRQSLGAGVSLVAVYREGSAWAAESGGQDGICLDNAKQLEQARGLIAQYCPKAAPLFEKNS